MSISPFSEGNHWFRGNLHTHTTISDGVYSPREVVELYKSRGWHFLALTDHETFTNWAEFNSADFLMVPGIEIGFRAGRSGRCHHIVGIHNGLNDAPCPKHMERFDNSALEGAASAQWVIEYLKSCGYDGIYCHPSWSRVEFEDIRDIKGFFAMEIYNHGCAVENHTGLSLEYWDSFLRRGYRIWGVAADDAHKGERDGLGGWIMVNAPDLSVRSIVGALRKGAFYSSNGPSIARYELDDGRIVVECSPVCAIHFVAYERPGKSYIAPKGELIECASYTLRGDELFVRVECVDEFGNTAWTNPIFITG